MSESDTARRARANRVLASLDADELDRIASSLELVPLPAKTELVNPDEALQHVCFPVSGIHSVTATMSNGASVEAGIINGEGVVGALEALARALPTTRCFTQIAGEGLRLPVRVFVDEFRRGGNLQFATLQWMQSFHVQVSQTAACNRLHAVGQRLARWLLMCHDRLQSDEIVLTQEFLAIMLGTPRPRITNAIGKLKTSGAITQERARIVVVDRERLEESACECYGIVRAAFETSSR